MENFSFLEFLILLLLGILLFRDQVVPALMSKLGIKMDKPASGKQMNTLTEHFNHETTELLTEIRDDFREMRADFREMSEGIKVVHRKHDEWEKHVFPHLCRKKESNK